MQPILPLTGSDVAGPLGLARLPRLWLETFLAATGRLPRGYVRDGRGFDDLLFERTGVEREALLTALARLPDYPTFERWFRAAARRVDAETIALVNAEIRDAAAGGVRVVLADALATWDALHAQVAGRRGSLEPIVPAVSAFTHGPLAIDHLARMWAKLLLETVDALPEGYRAGPVRVVEGGARIAVTGGLDLPLLERFGIPAEALVAFVAAEQPRYLEFEKWVRAHGARLEPERIAEHNAARYDARPEKAAAERAELGIDDDTLTWSYVLNDAGDWKAIHDLVTRA